MSITHFDYETTSACDIRLGAYRYASDPTTRILMYAISKDDGPTLLWDFNNPDAPESRAAHALLWEALETGELLYAHNAQFELAISTYRMEKDIGLKPPPLDRWRCTQAMCKRAAAPESLAKAAAFFGLEAQKNPAGKALIWIFSDQSRQVTLEPPVGMKDPATQKMQKNGKLSVGKKPKNVKSASPILDGEILWDWRMKVDGEMMTVRAAWELFCDYCRQDVRAEKELHEKLERFDLKGFDLESFQFDLRMNRKGVPVNIEALQNADNVVNEIKARLSKRFEDTTGLRPSQRAKALAWLQENGYEEENLQAGTVASVLASPPGGMHPVAVEMLKSYSLIQFAALAKIPAMLNSACPDGTVKGTTQWHGARTGRAAGRLVQVQNAKKSTIADSEVCYQLLREGWDAQWFEELWPSPLEAIASSIRHFIQPHNNNNWMDCDYTGVENRLAAWVVGDEKELKMMVDGEDMYKHMAVELFGVPYEKVTKAQRTTAKPVVLACGYSVGGRSLQEALATMYKTVKTREECEGYVKIYREGHPKTVGAWKEMEVAAVKSVRDAGKKFTAIDGKVEFLSGRVAGKNYMTMRLPSGRRMFYPEPEVKRAFMYRLKKEDEWRKADERTGESLQEEVGPGNGFWIDHLSFYGKIQGKVLWGRVGTYGGRLFENLCQAMGVDLLNYGCIKAEEAGFDVRMIVHDQILALDDGRDIAELQKHFCAKQEWASDFPLESSGAKFPYYLKD